MLRVLTITPDPALFSRDHNKALREANRLAAVHYHKTFMGDHFRMVGYSKYGIAKRSKAYNRRKQRELNHTLPLVYTGRTRQLVMSQYKVRATPKLARLEMRAAFSGGTGRALSAAAAARLFRAGRRSTATFSRKQVEKQIEAVKRKAELESTAQEEIEALARYRGREYVRLVKAHIESGGKVRRRGRGTRP